MAGHSFVNSSKRFVLRAWSLFAACSAVLALFVQSTAVAKSGPPASPLSAAAALEEFVVADGYKVELAACEPEVVDPVDVRFDERGRMWVVEMRDYPRGPAPGGPGTCQVRILDDFDRDGRFETSTVFADGLLFATGVQPWSEGAIITTAGEIAYYIDDNADGRSDTKEVWFTGFAQENPQLRANHPRWALDNRIYVANGLRDGVIAGRTVTEPLSIQGRNFRFDPRTLAGEAVSGHGQFGLTFDAWGERFECTNRNPAIHVVLPEQYLRANRDLAVSQVVKDVAQSGEASRVYPLTEAWTTSITHAGQFTAACGVEIYQGDLLGSELAGQLFICEPTGGLVHAETLAPDGVSFRSMPLYADREFLASRDPWFRPVNLETGPDDALYVVDMYRAVIEHPEWVPDELKNRPDERAGDDRGRIWRVVPNRDQARTRVNLHRATPSALVEALGHANGWWRLTAARLIYERADPSLVPLLKEAAGRGKSAVGRVHALWALAGLSALTDEVLREALADSHPRLREHAVVLAESRLARSAELEMQVRNLADDPDARVRFRVAFALSAATSDVTGVLVRIARLAGDDPWTRTAVLLTVKQPAEFLKQLTAGDEQSHAIGDAWLRETAELIGARGVAGEIEQVALVLALSRDNDLAGLVVMDGLYRGLARRQKSLPEVVGQTTSQTTWNRELTRWNHFAAEVAIDPMSPLSGRQTACRVLGHAPEELALPALAMAVAPAEPGELRAEALASVAALQSVAADGLLISQLHDATPAIRAAVLDAFLTSQERCTRLLDEVADGRLQPGEIDPVRRDRLTSHPDGDIAARAGQLLQPPTEISAETLAAYERALDGAARPDRGREGFRKHCATCHRIDNVGFDVGPNIADERTRTPRQLLAEILQPSRAIDANYQSFVLVTTSGQVWVGVLGAQTGSSITLKLPEGKTVTVLRDEVDEFRTSGLSLMPTGLERSIPPEELADVVTYVKNWRYLQEGAAPARTVTPANAP